MPAPSFRGAKLAVLSGGDILTLLRDDRPDIPFPGLWDLPGGGREGVESPLECALRETREELSLILVRSDICWRKCYPDKGGATVTWFFAARLAPHNPRNPGQPRDSRAARIALGDEGQTWRWMPAEEFLARPDAVPHLQGRLGEYLATI